MRRHPAAHWTGIYSRRNAQTGQSVASTILEVLFNQLIRPAAVQLSCVASNFCRQSPIPAPWAPSNKTRIEPHSRCVAHRNSYTQISMEPKKVSLSALAVPRLCVFALIVTMIVTWAVSLRTEYVRPLVLRWRGLDPRTRQVVIYSPRSIPLFMRTAMQSYEFVWLPLGNSSTPLSRCMYVFATGAGAQPRATPLNSYQDESSQDTEERPEQLTQNIIVSVPGTLLR
eukprot:COSAG02_NODE_1108_length_14539_cov_4.353393_12_plen_227_part_00